MLLLKLVFSLLVGVVIAWVWMYFNQEKMIFFPRKLDGGTAKRLLEERKDVEEIRLTMKDGTMLHGWFLRDPGRNLLLYFGGNAEEVSWLLDAMKHFPGWSVALVNYRGYGLSEGKPGEKELFSDSLEIYDFLSKRENISGARIVVMGRSLGTGVAVYLAQQREVGGLILVSPYDSLARVAKSVYPWVPVSLLLRHRFDSLSRAPSLKTPLLVLAADEDSIIPFRHSRELLEHWGGPTRLITIQGADHDSISTSPAYWKEIGEFLRAAKTKK